MDVVYIHEFLVLCEETEYNQNLLYPTEDSAKLVGNCKVWQ
jgi:hypothetical protein